MIRGFGGLLITSPWYITAPHHHHIEYSHCGNCRKWAHIEYQGRVGVLVLRGGGGLVWRASKRRV